MDEFEWDERTNCETIAARSIDFDDVISIFLGQTLEASDDRFDYNEVRVVAIGETGGQVFTVIYTMRGGVCRIISARKASRNERDAYYSAISARPPDRSD